MFTLHHMASPANALMEGLRVSRRLLIVLEDVYRTPLELHLLKLLDWSGNILISNDMSFPFNFKTENEWTAIFKDLGPRLAAVESIRPVPWRPSRHRIFVLEKQPPAYNREGSSTNKETHHVHTQSCPRPEGH
jgi:hypothetical protein